MSLFLMRTATMETEAGFLVRPKHLLAFGVFFGSGWCLSGHADLLRWFSRGAWRQLSFRPAALSGVFSKRPRVEAVGTTRAVRGTLRSGLRRVRHRLHSAKT